MTKLYRPLEAFEHIFAEGSADGSMTVVNLALLEGTLELEDIAAAADRLQAQYQILNVGIAKHGERWHFVPSQLPVSINYEVTPSHLSLKSFAFQQMEAECEMRFNQDGPLWRIRVILGESHHALLIASHHSICDGISAQLMLDQLVAELNAPSQTQTMAPIPSSVSQCVMHQATDLEDTPFTSKRIPDRLAAWVDTSQPITMNNSLAWLDIEAYYLQGLLRQCRQQGVTLNSLLTSVITKALARIATSPVTQVDCSANANARPYCDPKYADNELGAFAACFSIDVDTRDSTWQIAQKTGAQLAAIVDNHSLLNSCKHEWFEKRAEKAFPFPPLGRHTCLHFSNLGRLSFNQCDEALPLRITDCYFSSGQHKSGSVFWVGASTVNDSLNLTINCVRPLVPESMKLQFLQELEHGLMALL